MDIKLLIATAEDIVASELDHPDLLEKIERYCQEFENWSSVINNDLKGWASKNPDQARSLEVLHAEVIQRATSLKEMNSESLKGLKRVGKAILAYLDTLPRKISGSKPRKG